MFGPTFSSNTVARIGYSAQALKIVAIPEQSLNGFSLWQVVKLPTWRKMHFANAPIEGEHVGPNLPCSALCLLRSGKLGLIRCAMFSSSVQSLGRRPMSDSQLH